METTFDVIVVGAGIVGSSAAYQLAKDGQNVLLLDQFPLPHTRGSSSGHSRTLRRAYKAGHEHYTQMAAQSIDAWRLLEEETGLTIYREMGVLSVSFDPRGFEGIANTLTKHEVPHRKLSHAELSREFPMVHAPVEACAIFENQAGFLHADKAGKAFREVFIKKGGVVKDSQRVLQIIPGEVIHVMTQNAGYRGRRLVITAGPWANLLLKPLGVELPVKTWRMNVCYWKERTPGIMSSNHFPSLRFVKQIEHEGKHHIYCVPSNEYPGLFKLCLHKGMVCHPDERDSLPNDFDVPLLSRFVEKWLPDLEPKPAIIEKCFYTMTPDEGYILDQHPRWSNIIIGAGFSGHGFKNAPASGRILADLAMDRTPSIDRKHFSLGRFSTKSHLKASL